MTSKPVALLLGDLGGLKLHSRPYVSDDTPFSESQFKTMKYRPQFPERFGSLVVARTFGPVFFPCYNTEQHHSGIGLLTPYEVHHGPADQRIAERAQVLARADAAHPERFVGGLPPPPGTTHRGVDQPAEPLAHGARRENRLRRIASAPRSRPG